MEEGWIADHGLLRELLKRKPKWTNQQLADVTGRSLSWVKKWKKRIAESRPADEPILYSRSRAREHPPEKISEAVVTAILEIRDQPPEELQRRPGPRAILYYLQRRAELVAAGHRIPTSTSTVWRILDQHQRILRTPTVAHEPLKRPAPHAEWQIDFKDVTTATADSERRTHQVETLDIVDAGGSPWGAILVANPVRHDFNATTVITALADLFRAQGIPRSLRFDRDPRFVGSASGRDFPAAFLRFLLCIGVSPLVCPPRQPQKNPFVERFHRTYEEECIRTRRPTTVEETAAANACFRSHYNEQRPHQGLSCGNRPPLVAFPNLPPLPALPHQVDPDAWLADIKGRVYRRRINQNGSFQIGRQQYYVGTHYSGQTIAVMVRSALKIFDVILQQTVITSLPIKGLYNQLLPFDAYLHHICEEAESEYRRLLATQPRYIRVDPV